MTDRQRPAANQRGVEGRPLRVTFVSQSSYLYGSEKGLLELLAPPLPENFEPSVVLDPSGPFQQSLEQSGIPTDALRFNEHRVSSRPDWALRFIFRLCHIFRQRRSDAVVINFEGNVPLITIAALAARVPLFRMLKREIRPPDDRRPGYHASPADRWSFRRCRGVICISGAVARQLTEDLAGGTVPRTFPVWDPQDPVEVPAEEIRAVREELGLADGDRLVGTFCRVHPVKGLETFLRGIPPLLRDHPRTLFVIVGGPTPDDAGLRYERDLRQLAESLGISGQVRWLGFRRDTMALMAACDVTCLATRAEGLGRVILESWAVETPVVASDVDGPGEILSLSEGGILHPVDDPVQMAAGIARLLSDDSLRRDMGRAGRRWVQANCSRSEYRNRFLGALREGLAG